METWKLDHLDFAAIRTAWALRNLLPLHDSDAWGDLDDESEQEPDAPFCDCGCSWPARVDGRSLCGYCVAHERQVTARLERNAGMRCDSATIIYKCPEV